jgi:hypothetical protein
VRQNPVGKSYQPALRISIYRKRSYATCAGWLVRRVLKVTVHSVAYEIKSINHFINTLIGISADSAYGNVPEGPESRILK